MPSSNTVAYNAYSTQFENFGNTRKSLPKESESIAEQSLPEAAVAALKKSLAQNKRISALCLEQYEKGTEQRRFCAYAPYPCPPIIR